MNIKWVSNSKEIPENLKTAQLYLEQKKEFLNQNLNSDESEILDVILYKDYQLNQIRNSHFFIWLEPEDFLDAEIYRALKKTNFFLGTIGPFLSQDLVHQIIKSTNDRSIKNLRQIQIIQKAKNQNLQIENQVKNLNGEVEQKTQELNDYRKQLESRVAFEKESILILKNLLEASSFRSFRKIMLEAFKPYHVQNFFLFNKNELGTYRIQSDLEKLKKYDFKYEEIIFMDKSKWANISFNPVLDFKLISIGEKNEFFLAFEFSTFSHENFNLIQEHINYLQYIFKMILDYLYDKDKIIRDSKLWSSSFDSLDDPILIIDGYFKVLKSNIKTEQSGQSCFKLLFNRNSPCENCPIKLTQTLSGEPKRTTTTLNDYNLHSFPVDLSKDEDHKLWIHHYESLASINELKAQHIKSEKFSYLGQLVDKVIHQIANPLTGMKSSIEFLLASKPKALEEDLIEIQNGVLRCFEIINNLKEFSESEITLSKVKLSYIVNRTLVLMKSVTRDIEVQTEALHEARVNCPVGLVQQVLFNMFYNSCQAMNFKGRIILKTEVEPGFLNLIVSDSGPGINPNLKEKVFDPFFSTKSKDEGTGIGLFLSRQILRQFGGDLIVLDNLSPGAQLCIKFPMGLE